MLATGLTGFRVAQILKKHDKLAGNKIGQDFLQSLWSGSRRSHGAAPHSLAASWRCTPTLK